MAAVTGPAHDVRRPAPTAPNPCLDNASVPAALEDAARRFPANAAVQDGDHVVPYAQLADLARRTAAGLAARGAAPGSRVAVSLPRGWRLPVALAGVLRAGCCYVPLDPAYPAARSEFVLADTEPSLVIVDDEAEARGRDVGVPVLPLQQLTSADASGAPDLPGGGSLAYIIHTSGSTGRPKGVPITHDNLLSLFRAAHGLFDFDDRDRWSLFHSYAFDFSVWELWGALLYGGCAVVVPAEAAGGSEQFWRFLERQRISVLNQVPSVFAQHAGAGAGREVPLRWLIFGGEALDRNVAARCLRERPQTSVVNMYGITETTVHATFKRLAPADLADPCVVSPIGRALPHLRIDLRAPDGKPVGVGEVGEIHVSGAGVSRGYWRRPQTTAERFVADDSGLWYRSGDLGRRLESGELDYLGRNDDQLKVHGFRIEPAEVEAAFRDLPQVSAAAAGVETARDGGTILVLYYIPAADAPGDLRVLLRRRAAEALARHLRPTRFAELGSWPLTASGKLDRRGLAAAAGRTGGAP
jgi:nonribosomal peptide synthetase DhbF